MEVLGLILGLAFAVVVGYFIFKQFTKNKKDITNKVKKMPDNLQDLGQNLKDGLDKAAVLKKEQFEKVQEEVKGNLDEITKSLKK